MVSRAAKSAFVEAEEISNYMVSSRYSRIGSGNFCRHWACGLKKGGHGRSLCPPWLRGIAHHLSLTSAKRWSGALWLAQPVCFIQGSAWALCGMCWSCPAVEHCFVLPDLCSWVLKNLAFYLLLLVPARTVAGEEMMGLLLLLVTSFHLNCMFFQNRECAVAQSVALSKLLDRHFFQQETDWHLFHGPYVETFVCACIVQVSPFSK